MKKIITIACLMFIMLSCKKQVSEFTQPLPAEDPVAKEQINAAINNLLQQQHKFYWSALSETMVWSALQHTDNRLSVGYQPVLTQNVSEKLHLINVADADWKAAREKIIQQILISEQQLNPKLTLKDLFVFEDETLPFINVSVKNIATISLLRKNKMVRYAEPMAYEPEPEINLDSDSGCGGNVAESGLQANVDYTTISPNSKQSWNYAYHHIPAAWARTTGAGVKLFIIDTGASYDQDNLGSSFNQGASNGRSVEKIVTLPRSTFWGFPTGPVETPDDGCGHGTSMAGAACAPRGTDGAAVGVAYNSNLVTCRAAEDVLISSSREVTGVTNAYKNAAKRADVKIISMSMGKITGSSQIEDAINYAYGKGKLMFCAAGTSFSFTAGWYGVIFPAWLSKVNAVTGVRDNNFNENCSTCHKGSQTDFTIVMEKASNERHALTLAMSGNAPSTVGGSSVATATASGIAALVWSRFPSYSRDQILNKLIESSANYPNKNNDFGWGNLNADEATN